MFTVNGFSFSGQGQNSGIVFISLKPWEERSGDENGVTAIVERATVAFSQIKDGLVFPFNMPAILELGTATGFDFQLIDQANLGHTELTKARNQLLGMVREHPDLLVRVRPNGLEDTPQFKLDIDQEKPGVRRKSVGYKPNDFHGPWRHLCERFYRSWPSEKVYVQADAPFRMLPNDINNLYVRSGNGEMVPFSAFSSSHWIYGSPRPSVTTVCHQWKYWERPRRVEAPVKPWRSWKTRQHSCQPVSAMTGRGCHIRNGSPAIRHLRYTLFR